MNRFACLLAAATALFFLTACGDTENFTQINQTGVDVYASADDLPECTDENEGDQAFVKGEASARLCVDGEWFVTDRSSAKDTIVLAGDTIYLGGGDFSCKTEELADKSGLKIVCNGDSIGVVLNGAKGEDGKKGDAGCTISQNDTTLTVTCGDSTTTVKLGTGKPAADTTVNDTSDAAVSLDSLAGYSQKGPFLKGSTVYLYELDNGKSLKQTNGNFTSYIMNDKGYYKFTTRKVNPYALVIVDGNYRNEVTGAVSAQTIRLKALSDVRKHHKGANVNILTHLEYERVYYLVTKMDYDFDEAKQKAQEEVFRAFNIVLESNEDAETLDIFGKTDADAALLALSIMLQGDRSEAEMMALLTEISNALAEEGVWNDSSARAQVALWAAVADGQGRLDTFANHVKGWGLGDGTVPPFEKYVRNFYAQETGLGACGADGASQGTKKTLKAGSDTFNFVCEDVKKGWWRLLTKLDLDTAGWGHDFEEGAVRNGQVNTDLVYVYENNNWRHGTSLDSILGLSCIQARKDTLVQVSVLDWYKCVGDTAVSFEESNWNSVWRRATDMELDSNYWLSNKLGNEEGSLLKGPYTGKILVWDNDKLREPTETEIGWNKACVKSAYGKVDTLSNGLGYTCSAAGWSATGKFKDNRDYPAQIYKGVKIGSQTWMAENLNVAYKVKSGFYRTDTSGFCYKNIWTNCQKYGRLYPWSAAMDSAGIYTTANNCGDGTFCKASTPVRGICPYGWHLPSTEEWRELFVAVGGKKKAAKLLKSQTDGWGGLDEYSFSALPAGIRDDAGYELEGTLTSFWTSTEEDMEDAVSVDMSDERDSVLFDYVSDKFAAYSIRCVKD